MEYISGYKEEKEREISLRNLLLYLWDRIVIIVMVGLISGCIFGYGNYKVQNSFNPEVQKKATINTIIDQNRTAYFNRSTEYKPYTYDDLPSGSFNSIARIYLDYDFSRIENNTNMDYSSMVVRAHNDAFQLIVSEEALQEVIDELDLHAYSDMNDITPGELRWMISGFSDGTGVIQITVTDVDPQRAQSIADKALDGFVQRAKEYDFIDEVFIIDNASLPKGSGQIGGVSIDKKTLIKHSFIGFVCGAFLLMIVYILVFVLVDTVRDNADLEYVNTKCFGTIRKRQNEEDYKRIANSIVLSKDIKVLSLVPVDRYSEDFELVSKLEEEIEDLGKTVKIIEKIASKDIEEVIQKFKEKYDYIIIETKNIRDYGEAIVSASYSDAVIGIATYEKTKVDNIAFATKEIFGANNNLKGFIINSVKHI